MDIFFERHLVGSIDAVATPSPFYRYAPEWLTLPGAFPISTTLPLSDKSFGWDVVAPWLINLLPEDAGALRMMARILDVSHTDVLALLERVGRDTSGALSFSQRGTTANSVVPIESDADLEQVLNELPAKPFLAGDEGVSMSLAGVQSKLSVRQLDDGRIGIPIDGAPSSHILKPDSPGRLWGSVHNEAFCLTLAHRLGLPAASVTTGRAGKRDYLLVDRYDRVQEGDLLRRLHQEDFCQALGMPPGAKYQHSQFRGEKGSFARMMDRLREAGAGPDVMQMWDMLVFNVLSCNTDAHLKNHSLFLSANGVRLAPLYDVMCASVWPNITRNLALDVGGKRVGDYIEGRHWIREAEACGLAPRRALARVEQLAQHVRDELAATAEEVAAMPAGPHGIVEQVSQEIDRRCRTILNNLDK
ncbi:MULTISPECIES: type II toxin-antitoxin system HipA family toxin [Roseobacteraceae]|uniref:type II toxin-antitoxin system HipA family toxin n=1 Tax=Roseobacteraceae TaxID=2854170 RepID=UPI0031CF173A